MRKVEEPIIGLKVVRGPDWQYGEQDRGSKYGIITGEIPRHDNWVAVQWIGKGGKHLSSNAYSAGGSASVAGRGNNIIYDLAYYNEDEDLSITINTSLSTLDKLEKMYEEAKIPKTGLEV
jgi:hypothetical protein